MAAATTRTMSLLHASLRITLKPAPLFLVLLLLLLLHDAACWTVVESSPDSSILRVQDGSPSPYGDTIRLGHLLGLQALTKKKKASASVIWNDVAVFLAQRQFNERRGDILPHLPRLLEGCDFHWTYESRDTRQNALFAATQLIDAMLAANRTRVPFGFIGAHLSDVSSPLSLLGGAFELPQISGGSTSSELDYSPFFARTVANDEADAQGIMVYLQQIGVQHLANVYAHDEWGIHFNTALRKYSRERGIKLLSFPLDEDNPVSINSTMAALKKSQYRYVFAALYNREDVFRVAYQYEVLGNPDYVWFDGGELYVSNLQYDRATEHDLAMALHGIGTIATYQESYPRLDAAMQEMATNSTLQEQYFSHLADQSIVQNFTLLKVPYESYYQHYTNFDAVIAMGLAACSTPGLFTGEQLLQQLLQTEFDGSSGRVSFDPMTGSRDPASVLFHIQYVLLSEERSDADHHRFESHVAAVVRGDEIEMVSPFVYHNNRTATLPDIPLRQREELNLISPGVQWFGYSLAILSLGLSLVCLTWTVVYRGIFVVRAAQPIFLAMLCVGTFLIGSAIIPLSFPGAYSGYEGNRGLNAACMAPIWLMVLGFVIAFSSIHAKTRRMLKIMNSANQMVRTKVKPKDVIRPFLLLMTINVALLLCMTILAPFTFVRIPMHNDDEFGRSVASYGSCQYFENREAQYYLIPLWVVDALWLVLVFYQAYQARNLSTAFSESSYLALTVLSLLETFLLGGAVLLAVKDKPAAFYICASILLAVSVAGVLLPIFLPKYYHRKIERGLSAIQRKKHNIGSGERTAPPSSSIPISNATTTTTPALPSSVSRQAGCESFQDEMPAIDSANSLGRQSPPSSKKGPRKGGSKNSRGRIAITARDNSWHFETEQGNKRHK